MEEDGFLYIDFDKREEANVAATEERSPLLFNLEHHFLIWICSEGLRDKKTYVLRQ